MKKQFWPVYRLFIILIMAFIAACNGRPAQSPASAPTQAAAPNDSQVESVVSNGFTRIQENPHREDCNTDFGDKTIPTVIEFQPPDRRHILDTENPDDAEAYLIGDIYYWFDPASQKWNKTAMNGNGQESTEPTRSKIEMVGEESASGKPLQVYQFEQTAEQYGVLIIQQMKVWISPEDGLIYRTFSEGDVLGLNDKGEAFKRPAKANCTFEYDPKIEVNAPVQ